MIKVEWTNKYYTVQFTEYDRAIKALMENIALKLLPITTRMISIVNTH